MRTPHLPSHYQWSKNRDMRKDDSNDDHLNFQFPSKLNQVRHDGPEPNRSYIVTVWRVFVSYT